MSIHQMRKIWSLFSRREKMLALLLFLASLITAFAQAFGVFAVFPFINVVMDPGSIETNAWLSFAYRQGGFSDADSFLIVLGIAVFLIIVFSSLIAAVTSWAKARFVMMRNHSLSRRLLASYLVQDYEFFLRRNSSELSTTILSEVNQLTQQYLIGIFDLIISVLITLFLTVMLFLVDSVVTLGALLFLGLTYFLISAYLRRKLRIKGEQRLVANKERFKMAGEALSSIKTTKVMGSEDFFLGEYSKPSVRFARLNTFAKVAGELPHHVMECLAFGGIVFFIVFQMLAGHEVSQLIPLVSLFAFAGKRMLPAIQKIYTSIANITYNQPILNKVHADIHDREARQAQRQRKQRTDERLLFDSFIKLSRVHFSYRQSDHPVLDGIDLILPKNAIVGFVGTTGSGKTTLIDVIMGLLMPQEGSLSVDDVVITKGNLHAWQQKIGYVPQDIFLADDTIRHNIAFGLPEAKVDEARLREAARLACLSEFVETQLPEQYDTMVGERGVRLSGGQRQRIGLARAIYRDPEVLVLDEATSALDGATEEAILKAIGSASRSRTVLMIAHRLNTLKDCDTIYLLDQGRILDHGTYSQLMQTNSQFIKMAKLGKS